MQIKYKSNMYLCNRLGLISILEDWGVGKMPYIYCFDDGVKVTLAELSKITGIQDYNLVLNVYYRPFYLQLDDEVTYKGITYRVGDFVKTNYSKSGVGLNLIGKKNKILVTKETLLKNEKIKLEKGYLVDK